MQARMVDLLVLLKPFLGSAEVVVDEALDEDTDEALDDALDALLRGLFDDTGELVPADDLFADFGLSRTASHLLFKASSLKLFLLSAMTANASS